MSEFGALSIALSSLQTQQRALEIAANNVANANTPGYTRQSADMTTLGAQVTPAIWSTTTGDGNGVQISAVTRFRDAFMEIQAGFQHGSLANLDQANATLQQVQNVFPEPSDSGIAAQISSLWSAWDSVANNPGDNGARSVLLQQANTVASSINSAASSLQQMKTNETSQLGILVTQINTTAASLAQVNQSIKSGSLAGLNVNTLEDQRDQLANQLAQLTGGTIQSGANNQVTVALNGTNLVFENHAQALTLDAGGPNAVLRVVQGGFAVSVTSGQAGGMLNDVNTVLPGFLTQLDNVATTLRDQVNNVVSPIAGNLAPAARDQTAAGALQFGIALDGGAVANLSVAGADWSGAGGAAALQTALQTALNTAIGAGNATATVTTNGDGSLSVGIAPTATHALQVQASGANPGFSTLLGGTPVGADGIGGRAFFSGTNALTLAVSAGIAGNPAAIAAGVVGNGPLDSSIALQLGDMSRSSTGADTAYNTMIVQLGVAAKDVQTRDNVQQQSVQSLDAARNSQAGVNTDEEMTNMVEYQKAYEASAKFVSAIDQMLTTLIAMVGP
jgi:flagellar hook-associated protein 1 FlgK